MPRHWPVACVQAFKIVPLKYRKRVSILYYALFFVIGIVLLVANGIGILAAVGITHFPERFTQVQCLFLMCISVTFMSTLLWFGIILEVFNPNPGFQKLITRTLIGGIFAAVVVALKAVLT
jgi:hypothetical protein